MLLSSVNADKLTYRAYDANCCILFFCYLCYFIALKKSYAS
jgi:hypothetical protein